MQQELSNVTSQPFPTLPEVVKEMLELYLNNNSYGDFWDASKVIYQSKHEDIVREVITQMENMSEVEMLKRGLCPNCGTELKYRYSLERYVCPNDDCSLTYEGWNGRVAI